MHFSVKQILVLAAITALTACSGSPTRDTGLDSHNLADLVASIWVDPDGCKHWIIDDGIEGYMSPVLNTDGTPDCV